MQINMHMNGDAAVDQALKAIETAVKKYGMRDHRPVFIHASYVRPDQIARVKAVGAIPAFTVGSLPFGGDIIMNLWGAARSNTVAAAATYDRKGVKFSWITTRRSRPNPTSCSWWTPM